MRQVRMLLTLTWLVSVSLIMAANVTGHVVGNNATEIGLAGARVTLDGATDYVTTTDDNGDFHILGVVADTYALSVWEAGYARYSDSLSVDTADITLGTITLIEQHNSVSNLRAHVASNNVTLTWNIPSDITLFDFEANDGEFVSDNPNGWQWGTNIGLGTYSGTHCWNTALEGTYAPNCDDRLVSPGIEIESNFYLTFPFNMISEATYDGGNVSISTDNGATWTLLEPIGGYSCNSVTGLDYEPGYSGNTGGFIWATFDLSAYAGQNVRFCWRFGSDANICYLGWAVDDVRVGPSMERTVAGYQVYRNGTYLTQVNDCTFSDANLPDGEYQYSIIAVYVTGLSDPVSVSCLVYPINITGFIVGSDATDSGLTGATITLQNAGYCFQTTSVDGAFYLPNVNGMSSYDISIWAPGYETWHPTPNPINVLDEDLFFNQIILQRSPLPPSQVVATETPDGSTVTVHWDPPNYASPTIQWCHDSNYYEYGTGNAAEFEIAARWTQNNHLSDYDGMYLSKVDFWPAENGTYEVRIYTGGHADVDTGEYSSGTLVCNQAVTNVVPGRWNGVRLDTPVAIPSDQELWIAIHITTSSGYPAGCDSGPEIPGYGNLIQWNGVWEPLTTLDTNLTYNWNIRGHVTSANDRGFALSSQSRTRDADRQTLTPGQRSTYSVYRLIRGQENNPAAWLFMETTTDSMLVETDFNTLSPNTYLWAVGVNYGDGVQSSFTFSNSLTSYIICAVTLHVVHFDDTPIVGACLTLINQDGDPSHVYQATSQPGGVFNLGVWKGIYNLRITYAGCLDYEQTTVDLQEDTRSLTVRLVPLLPTVTNLQAVVSGPETVTVSWEAPARNILVRQQEQQRNPQERALLGYRIDCDGSVVNDCFLAYSYTISNLLPGAHTFSVYSVYTSGTSPATTITLTGTDDPVVDSKCNALLGNSPNPFNPTTTIAYSLAKSEPVSLTIYSLRGQKVTTLVSGTQSAGKHTVTWNGTDDNGRFVASGVYFCRMEAGSYSATQKMMMMK